MKNKNTRRPSCNRCQFCDKPIAVPPGEVAIGLVVLEDQWGRMARAHSACVFGDGDGVA